MQQGGSGWVRRTIGIRAAAPEPAPAEEAAGSALRTFIDRGADFHGTLRLRESLRIDSEFRGAIESEGTVTVGETAGVEADIRAREVVICGAVVGDVVATRQLTIRPGGRLHGDVETPCLEIGKHAFFNGRTTMTRPEQAARAGAEAGPTAQPPRASSAPALVGLRDLLHGAGQQTVVVEADHEVRGDPPRLPEGRRAAPQST